MFMKNRVGEKQMSKFGQMMEIVAYRGNADIDVKFEDGTIVKHRNYQNFKIGSIKNPKINTHLKPFADKRIGESKIAKNGQRVTIIAYRGNTDIDVQFEDGTILRHKHYRNFQSGYIGRTAYIKKHKKKRTGRISKSVRGQKMKIIKYRNSLDIDVQFEDGTIVEHKTYSSFLTGTISNPNFKNTHIGESKKATNTQMMKIIAFRDNEDIDVEFEDGTIVTNKSYRAFKLGSIKNPNVDIKLLRHMNEKGTSKEGYPIKIVNYISANNLDVEFEDGTIVTNKTYTAFKEGRIKKI